MDSKYLQLLAREFPTVESVACEMINLSAILSLPKGTEYFFSDLHGEYESFLHLLRSASGMVRAKVDLVFQSTLTAAEREALTALIVYPEKHLHVLQVAQHGSDVWRRKMIYRLILVCEAVSAKYTRSRVRKKMPEKFVYILDELLNVTDDINKDFYYDEIIRSILETGIADSFIAAVCHLIQQLCIDRLHIIGDIFDRGPRADIIMDELMRFEAVDIQWGNHDISWMGAASGNRALIANVLRVALSYNSFDVLEDGYGLNLRALAVFAAEVYQDDPCTLFYPHELDENLYDDVDAALTAKMHKAIAVIQLKLEGDLIRRHAEYEMDSPFARTDFARGCVVMDGKRHPLKTCNFPTVLPDDPLRLSAEEEALMDVLCNSFLHSARLHEHIRFLYAHGGMYRVYNNNLLYHGCIPMREDGAFLSMNLGGRELCGKALLDALDQSVRTAYFGKRGSKEKADACDRMWYLWCGAKSPLFGKDKMTTFAKYFLSDTALHEEHYNPYYQWIETGGVCERIMEEFGVEPSTGHIINGHVPVKLKDGESPIKAGGKLFIIDGGISKAYQSRTGIAGYTLIYDSHSLRLAEHSSLDASCCDASGEEMPTVRVVETMPRRMNIADTDTGRAMLEQIDDLKQLLEAYRSGVLREAF